MVLFNYAIREVTAKLVYYGPGLCGKTTNLQFIHEKLDPSARGKLLSLATDGDRTLFFDFLPIEMGSIGGYKVRFQLYTVPGQVHYNATRKLVLKGVDAVAFVADSQLSMVERNRESFENLIENLIENGYDPAKIPIVIQLNKRDLPNVASVGDLVAVMGVEGYPVCEAVASRGDGVFETLKTIVKLTLSRLRTQFDARCRRGSRAARDAAAAPRRPRRRRRRPRRSSAPPPPPRTPRQPHRTAAARAETEVPAVPIDGLDEFDLEDFSDETAAPARGRRPGSRRRARSFRRRTTWSISKPTWRPSSTANGRPRRACSTRRRGDPSTWRTAEPTCAGLEDREPGRRGRMARGDAAFDDGAPPPRSPSRTSRRPGPLEMMEELQRLRAENSGLREALRGITTLLDRQIGVLQDGREELDRHVGEIPGESAP